jgi:hypothetical protein
MELGIVVNLVKQVVSLGMGAGNLPQANDIYIFTKSRQHGWINTIINILIYR